MSDAVRYITTDLPQLLKVLQSSDVSELRLQDGPMQVRIHCTPSAHDDGFTVETAGFDTAVPAEFPSREITAPMVGTFYRAAEPESPALVDTGTVVEVHTVVGIIEALQVLNPVEAGLEGIVTGVLATDGQPVGYGDPLFEITPGG